MLSFFRFAVSTAFMLRILVFWDVTLCNMSTFRRNIAYLLSRGLQLQGVRSTIC